MIIDYFTELYISMCEKADELQKYKKQTKEEWLLEEMIWEFGDYFYVRLTNTIHCVNWEEGQPNPELHPVWLPVIEQIYELLYFPMIDAETDDTVDIMVKYVNDKFLEFLSSDHSENVNSLSEAWLRFFMFENGKVWNKINRVWEDL